MEEMHDDMSPVGRIEPDSDPSLIAGQEPHAVLRRLKALAKRLPRAFGREMRDIRLAETAVKFLDAKVAPVYFRHDLEDDVSLELAKIAERLDFFGYPIRGFERFPGFHDVPHFDAFAVGCRGAVGGGSGFRAFDAAASALAEAVERCVFQSPKQEWVSYRQDRRVTNDRFPAELLRNWTVRSGEDSGRVPDGDRTDSIRIWARGVDRLRQKSVWLPAQLVFYGDILLGMGDAADKIKLAPRTSSGCACGATLEEAVGKAVLELVERDAFLVSWLRMVAPKRLSLDSIAAYAGFSKDLKELVEKIRRFRFELNVLVLPTDFPVHVIAAVLRDHSEVGPAVSVGAHASFSAEEAMAGAILETLSVYQTSRLHSFGKNPGARNGNASADGVKFGQRERTEFWARSDAIPKIDWFLKGEEIRADSIVERGREEGWHARLDSLASHIRGKGFHLFVYAAPDRFLRDMGFWPVRAIIPELMPLYLKEDQAPLHHPRLGSESRLNPVPHPFP